MTLEEKVGQMCVPILQSDIITDDIKKCVQQYKVGMVRYCPSAEFDNASVVVGKPNRYFQPDESAAFLNELQLLSELPLIISVDQEGGVLSMGKHFPGYGSIATDAHKGTAHITKTVAELEQEDIVPFRALIDAGVDGIMMGHVITDAIDPVYPATLSKSLTTDYLRNKLGFNGIIMTDAMRMKAIQDNYGTGPASVLAIQAGCDLVLLRGDMNHFEEGYFAILEAARSGELSEDILNASVLRILKAKADIGLFENRYSDPRKATEIVGSKEHQELLFRLASKSISVLKEMDLPLVANDGKKIAVISVEPQKIAAAMDEKQCVDMLEKEIKAIHANTSGVVIPLDPEQKDIKMAVDAAKDADVIVLGMCSGIIFRTQQKLYDALNAIGKTLIVVAMESPCDIELIPDCRNYIMTYGVARDWMKVAAMRMFGLTTINAKPAITIPEV